MLPACFLLTLRKFMQPKNCTKRLTPCGYLPLTSKVYLSFETGLKQKFVRWHTPERPANHPEPTDNELA